MSASGVGVEARRQRQQLKPAQVRVLEELAAGRVEITRADYERLGHVSRSQAAYDLAELVDKRILERVGSGRATRYRPSRSRSGRPRSWTDERIRAELLTFCAGRDLWPSAADFRSSGHGDLYLAVCRYGGIDHWADELGVPRAPADPAQGPVEPGPLPTRRRRGVRLPLLVALVAVDAIAVVAAAAWLTGALDGLGPGESGQPRQAGPAERPIPRPAGGPAARKQLAGSASARTEKIVVSLVGVGRDSRLTARRRTSRGPLLFSGVLQASAAVRLEGRRIWVQLGAPGAVRLLVDGRATRLPGRARTFVVTEDGVRVVRTRNEGAPNPAPAPSAPDDTIPITDSTTSADSSPSTSAPASGSGSQAPSSGSSAGSGSTSSSDGLSSPPSTSPSEPTAPDPPEPPAPDPPDAEPPPDPKP